MRFNYFTKFNLFTVFSLIISLTIGNAVFGQNNNPSDQIWAQQKVQDLKNLQKNSDYQNGQRFAKQIQTKFIQNKKFKDFSMFMAPDPIIIFHFIISKRRPILIARRMRFSQL